MRVITGIWVFVGSLLVTSSCPGAPLVISETGVAKAVILLPAAPTNLETFAAGELADCLGRMSGDTFQVTKEGSGPGQNQPVISVRMNGIACTGLPHDAFIIPFLLLTPTPRRRAPRIAPIRIRASAVRRRKYCSTH